MESSATFLDTKYKRYFKIDRRRSGGRAWLTFKRWVPFFGIIEPAWTSDPKEAARLCSLDFHYLSILQKEFLEKLKGKMFAI